jgi:hypothetical protein
MLVNWPHVLMVLLLLLLLLRLVLLLMVCLLALVEGARWLQWLLWVAVGGLLASGRSPGSLLRPWLRFRLTVVLVVDIPLRHNNFHK